MKAATTAVPNSELILRLSEQMIGGAPDIWVYGSRAVGLDSDNVNIYIEYDGSAKPEWPITNGLAAALSKLFKSRCECIFRPKAIPAERRSVALVAVSSGMPIRGDISTSGERAINLQRGYSQMLEENIRLAKTRVANAISRFGQGEFEDDISHDAFLYELKRTAAFLDTSLLRSVLFASGIRTSRSVENHEKYSMCHRLGMIGHSGFGRMITDIQSYGADYVELRVNLTRGLH